MATSPPPTSGLLHDQNPNSHPWQCTTIEPANSSVAEGTRALQRATMRNNIQGGGKSRHVKESQRALELRKYVSSHRTTNHLTTFAFEGSFGDVFIFSNTPRDLGHLGADL